MPDLLLELFSEEIPARMQAKAAEDLRRLVTDGLVAAGLTYEGAKAFVTPRRLSLTVQGLTARSADLTEERKGPRVGAPAQALEGFLRAAGLASIEEAQVQSDPKKGEFYVAVMRKPGRTAEDILAELLPRVVREFPWPKSMRWGARSAPPDSPFSGAEAAGAAALRWVRPLRSILCTFGPETEEPVVVPIDIAGIASGEVTYGHRFMAGGEPIRVRRFDDYVPALERAKVVLDAERRKAIIAADAKNLAFAQGLELVEDSGLLDEVAGLVEWPVVLMGSFDPAFLQIPDEVIRLTIRQNQKCFVVRQAGARVPPPSPATGEKQTAGRLANRFVLTANIEASDGGAAIVAGNERVIAARLADARFFWEQDRAVPLEAWAKKLDGVTFHEKLGSQAERVEHIARLASELAPLVGADPDDAERAARLAKADLTTGMVGEFPELQGVMGRYYFLAQNGLSAPNLPLEGRSSAAEPLREGVDAEGVRAGVEGDVGTAHSPIGPPGLSSRFGREAETGIHSHGASSEGSGGYGSRTGADAPSGMTTGDGGAEAAQPDASRLRAIADAIRDHYKPQGPNDIVPTEPMSVAVALADKLDTLVGFWAIDEKPTGSKDPFALRRAALGVIRSIIQIETRIPLARVLVRHHAHIYQRYEWAFRILTRDQDGFFTYPDFWNEISWPIMHDDGEEIWPVGDFFVDFEQDAWIYESAILPGDPNHVLTFQRIGTEETFIDRRAAIEAKCFKITNAHEVCETLLAFFADRLKVHLRETGARHDLIDAVFALPGQDDLLMIVRRVEALGKFLDTEDGANLLVGYRRAANILRAEEKKEPEGAFGDAPDPNLIEERGLPEERALFQVMQAAERQAREHVAAEDFGAAMRALAELRPAVDAFFDKVTVNADDPALRANRLKLLNMLRQATLAVADFSKIGG